MAHFHQKEMIVMKILDKVSEKQKKMVESYRNIADNVNVIGDELLVVR